MTMAAVDALHRSFPGSEKWPMACAGFSGGGKGVGYVAPFLARYGCHITGIYITGANEDHLSDGYARLRPGADFLNTPIYFSSGHEDRIATMEQQYAADDVVGGHALEQSIGRGLTPRAESVEHSRQRLPVKIEHGGEQLLDHGARRKVGELLQLPDQGVDVGETFLELALLNNTS